MCGLPTDFDASVFVGTRLDSITFYEFMVMFSFEDGDESVRVSVESSFSFAPPGERTQVPIQASDAMRHIGRTVTGAACETSGTIELNLDDGTVLRFFEDEIPYESYSIFLPGGRQVIV